MKKILIFLLTVIFISLCCKEVKAETAHDYFTFEKIDGFYINYNDNGSIVSKEIYFIRRASDGKVGYNLTPELENNETALYSSFNLSLDESLIEKAHQYANFGYGYGNHTNNRWYVFTGYLFC